VDTETAIKTQIEPQLITVFGLQVANSMLTRATLCYALADGDEEKRYRAFVHSICSEEHAVRIWGPTEAAEHERAWGDLIRSEPHMDADEPQEEDRQ
jgi:hypothetical protein